jgi:hypothetical protein
MDQKLVLVKAITLLYRESTLSEKESNSSDLIRNVLGSIKLPEVALSIGTDRQLLMNLRDTVQYMCDNPLDTVYDKTDLLQRLKVNCSEDDKLYEAFVQGIEKEMDESNTKKTVLGIRKYINDTFRENEIINIIGKASTKLRFNRESIQDVRAFVHELKSELEPYEMEASRKDPAIVGTVDLGDNAQLTTVLTEVQEQNNEVSILRFGWQGLNRMCQGGARRGEAICTSALQHNYKTGSNLSIFKHVAMYNVPHMLNPAKKPLLLRISFEDNLALNIQFLYQNIFQNKYGELPNIKKTKLAEMAEFIKQEMSVNGYHVKFMRVNPSGWTYRDIQNTVISLEAEGYEIHMLQLDYLAMVPTTGCIQGASGDDLRDLWRRMRNFCSSKGITLMSPHQLSSEAKQLVRDGRTDFVKQIANKGYYDGCKRLDQELDLELHFHIEHLNGESFLTIQRGKHRIPSIIPEKDKHMVLKFTEKGCILDDLNGPDTTLRKVGGGPIGSAEETPFFEFKE